MSNLNIRLESTNKSLSSLGGLHVYSNIIDKLGLRAKLSPHLPANKIATSADGFTKFKALALGLVAGADCLDDMDRLAVDPAFDKVCGYVNAANTYGDYLRSTTPLQRRGIQEQLIETALQLRQALKPKDREFILDLDSTGHEQTGKKMEGVAWNYKNEWCLDSLEAYDQFGLNYWMEVREGNTFTANGGSTAVREIFKRVSKKLDRFIRMDSGYCNGQMFNAAYDVGAKFICPMRDNMSDSLIGRVKHWKKAKDVKAKGDRDCELGHTIYHHKEGREILRVIVIRAQKVNVQNNALFDSARFDYYAFVTNIGAHEMSDEEAILFYRGRGNAENFIKEFKYGFDMKHLPCLSLAANKAYALIAAYAYNLMRYTAFVLDEKKPRFSKTIRFRMVNLACQVVSHARTLTLRFNKHVLKEVQDWLIKIDKQFGLVIAATQ